MRKSKLTADQTKQLHALLMRRRELLLEVEKFSPRRLAAKYGVHHQTVWRLDVNINGYHVSQPSPEKRRKRAKED